MPDTVDKETRSRMMSGIRGKNTKPEVVIRSLLHGRGFRFRLHDKKLPGRPDIVLPKHRAVVFVNGCFWHGHDCHLFKWPNTRQEWWRQKIEGTQARDESTRERLEDQGWRIADVWECALKGKTRLPVTVVAETLSEWIQDPSNKRLVLEGQSIDDDAREPTSRRSY